MNNRVEVMRGGRSHFVAIAVPAGLFTILKDVFGVPVDADVTLAVDLIGERYVFSIMYGDELRDCWDYSERSLPAWMLMQEYRL